MGSDGEMLSEMYVYMEIWKTEIAEGKCRCTVEEKECKIKLIVIPVQTYWCTDVPCDNRRCGLNLMRLYR
jgi:hypothetical protein